MPQYYVDLHNLKQAQTQLTKEEEDLRKKYDNVFLFFNIHNFGLCEFK